MDTQYSTNFIWQISLFLWRSPQLALRFLIYATPQMSDFLRWGAIQAIGWRVAMRARNILQLAAHPDTTSCILWFARTLSCTQWVAFYDLATSISLIVSSIRMPWQLVAWLSPCSSMSPRTHHMTCRNGCDRHTGFVGQRISLKCHGMSWVWRNFLSLRILERTNLAVILWCFGWANRGFDVKLFVVRRRMRYLFVSDFWPFEKPKHVQNFEAVLRWLSPKFWTKGIRKPNSNIF